MWGHGKIYGPFAALFFFLLRDFQVYSKPLKFLEDYGQSRQVIQTSLGRLHEKLVKRINPFNLLHNNLVNYYYEQSHKYRGLGLGLDRVEGGFKVSSSESLAGCKCWDSLTSENPVKYQGSIHI